MIRDILYGCILNVILLSHAFGCSSFRDRFHLEITTPVHSCQLTVPVEPISIVRALSKNGEHAFKKAVYNNHHQEMRRLIKSEKINNVLTPDAQTDGDETVLLYACRPKKVGVFTELPDIQTVKILIEHGADPFVNDNKGNTPFIHAAQCGTDRNSYPLSKELASLLVKYAYTYNNELVSQLVKQKNNEGVSAEIIARNNNNTELVSYIEHCV